MNDCVDRDDVNLLDIRDVPVAAGDFEQVEVIESDPFEDVVTEEIVLLDMMRLETAEVEVLWSDDDLMTIR